MGKRVGSGATAPQTFLRSDVVYLLWFVNEMADREDAELLIGVYSSESEAKAAIDRLKGQRGFVDFPEGFQICPYELNRDHWTEGFRVVEVEI
jgi:homoserine kinase type II